MIFFARENFFAAAGILVAIASAFAFPACGDAGANAGIAMRERADFSAVFPIFLDAEKIEMRLALTELERRRGLTGCRALAENAGMLFVYADAERRAFWMRGVPVNLSIGFFDSEGILLETHEMFANDLRSTFSESDNVRFVLEMPAGWFSRKNIASGARLNLPEIVSAVRARGFSPENFNL